MNYIAKKTTYLVSLLLIILVLAVQVQAEDDIVLQNAGRIADHTPYHCLIRRQLDRGWGLSTYFSSGSIVSPKHILSSAATLFQEGTFVVGLGSNRHDQLIYYPIDRWYVHPNFLYVDKRWSIGVLVLQHSLTFTSFIQPVALPPLGVHGPLWREQGQITSFDKDTGILKTAYQRINNQTFDFMGEDTKIWGEYEDFNRGENCAFVADGAGLIVRLFGVDTIMGLAIVSSDCTDTTPTVYARVTKGREWLHEEFGI